MKSSIKSYIFHYQKKKKNNFSASSSIRSLETIVGIYQSLKSKKEIVFPINKKFKIKLGN